MEGVGNEVSRKIKAAIKAKLIELGAYVDDELPDYIMIMVANKRSKSQMDSDLSLFLNKNTKTFTTWLHTVLEKLQKVTVAATEKKSESKKRESSIESKSSKYSDKHNRKKKKRKEKKEKKKSKKQKLKERKDSEDEAPKKKPKKEKTDIAKEVGKAIIGSLKEKHKTGNEAGDQKKKEDPEKPIEATPEPLSENNKNCSVEIIQSDEPEKTLPVMAPTIELLKEHDQKIETERKESSSEDSLEPPEELRRQLLLSRTQQKLKERSLASRMRSNSPEVVVIEPDVAEKTESSKLSLRPLSTATLSVESDREPSPKKLKQISSLIVKPVEPGEPEISSVVQIKPRDFVPVEKQANRHLILKAIAAAEQSVASIPKSKDLKQPREIFTRELREKRYENLSVTVGQSAEKHSEASKDDSFISCKSSTNGKTESFIKDWLDDVEAAGSQERITQQDDLNEKLPNGQQIVITVDALSSEDETNPQTQSIKMPMSARFGQLNQTFKEHELMSKFEHDRKRKRTDVGESKNKRLIAELSMKFGKVDRIYRDKEKRS